jgi:MFS superfamily sulfate permease-like transporter
VAGHVALADRQRDDGDLRGLGGGVAPLADGDVGRFAALSAALAIVTAIVLVVAGKLRLGAIADLVSKPVMTGFMFGLGLTIAIQQVPSVVGLDGADGTFFDRLGALARHLDDVDGTTAAVGVASIVLLVASRRALPRLPAPLIVLALAIAVSAVFDLRHHGVETVGEIPRALPDPAVPDVSATDVVALIAPAFGVLVLTAESIGVARALAAAQGARVNPNRDLVALGAANLLGGLSSGFVQSGGASQTAAADEAGGKTQLTAAVCAVLILLTGAFLGPVFTDLPQATLAAVVIVAVAGFWDVAELRRYARIRTSALVFAGLALVGVLGLGVLQGLIVTAGLTLLYLIRGLARTTVEPLVRDRAAARGSGPRAVRTGWRPTACSPSATTARCSTPTSWPPRTACSTSPMRSIRRCGASSSTSAPAPTPTCRWPTRSPVWPTTRPVATRSSGSSPCARRRARRWTGRACWTAWASPPRSTTRWPLHLFRVRADHPRGRQRRAPFRT